MTMFYDTVYILTYMKKNDVSFLLTIQLELKI